MEAIIALAAPLTINALMAFFKAGGLNAQSVGHKRFVLALLSLVGVLATAAMTGTQPDMATIKGLVDTLLSTVVLFITSHGSYKLLIDTK